MTPFSNDYFFYVLGILMIPAIILGLKEKSIKWYGLFATLIFIVLTFNTVRDLIYVAAFLVFSYGVVLVYFAINSKKIVVFWIFLLLILVPLILSKGILGWKDFHFLGISYVTFRTVQYITGIKEGSVKKISVFVFLYFVLFFPSISSGPIDRLGRFQKELGNVPTKQEYFEMMREGLWKLANGLLFGFVIAPVINHYLLKPVMNSTNVLGVIEYGYAYGLYLFFNFAGYSKMAIGAGYIFGVKMPENFNMPFASRDIKEFWTRWHITLSTFFKDYIYNKIITASIRRKWFKNPRIGSYVGYIITMSVMGVWHGLSLRYIVYGIYHGVLMCLNDIADNNFKWFKKVKNHKIGSIVCAVITFHLYVFGLLIFLGKLFE